MENVYIENGYVYWTELFFEYRAKIEDNGTLGEVEYFEVSDHYRENPIPQEIKDFAAEHKKKELFSIPLKTRFVVIDQDVNCAIGRFNNEAEAEKAVSQYLEHLGGKIVYEGCDNKLIDWQDGVIGYGLIYTNDTALHCYAV